MLRAVVHGNHTSRRNAIPHALAQKATAVLAIYLVYNACNWDCWASGWNGLGYEQEFAEVCVCGLGVDATSVNMI